MMNVLKAGIAITTMSVFLSGCFTTQDAFTGESQIRKSVAGTGLGAAAGALAGAIIGNNVGDGNARRGALIGAGIGALTGAGVGHYLDRQEAELRAELQGSGVSVTRTQNGILLNMPSNITFASGRDQVEASFYPVLNSVAVVLNKYDKSIVDVMGHTDSDGDDAFNLNLSQNRAQNVARYLVGQGVNSRRFAAQGFGESRPVASNATPQGKALNRRVEIQISPLTQG